jgi:Domain of unknown function (DUF4145)
MLIDCTHCQARVNAEVLKLAGYYDREVWPDSYQLALLRCPECRHLVVGQQSLLKEAETDFAGNVIIEDEEWSAASRVWPEPLSQLAMSIPEAIRTCLLEARKCLHATAYTACVAMSGRAIEAMCRHFDTKKDMLFEGLKELHERDIIDARLYEWGDELRKHRNLAAHASGVKFNLADAKDLYDFATAICDYVFVLAAKFESFKKRQQKQEAHA